MEHDAAHLDLAAVERYLAAHLPGFRGPLTAKKFTIGQSNPTFRLDSPSGTLVLRRKPPGVLLKSAHAVDRECRVQKALAGSDVPMARMHLLCEDEGVIGAMFYVMDFQPGRHFMEPTLADLSPDQRGAVFDEMNRVLAALHSVDCEAVGLGDFGRPGSYFARQIGRWPKPHRAPGTARLADPDRPRAPPPAPGRRPVQRAKCAVTESRPGRGHACGHNIVAAAAIGAGLAAAEVAGDVGLTVTVFGTPAEEGGGGKILLLERGAFEDQHAAMMVHPAPADTLEPMMTAIEQWGVKYTGKSAHAAAAPQQGINAADALTVAQVAIGLMRQHMRPTDLVHGIVTDGGAAPNIIPAPPPA